MIKVYLFTLVAAMFLSCNWGSATDSPQSGATPQDDSSSNDPNDDTQGEENPQNQDQIPPVLASWGYNSQGIYCFTFDEVPQVNQESWQLEPAGSLELRVTGSTLELHWQEAPQPAREYKLSLTVEDTWGNSNWFILPFWTPHPQGAVLLLNEVNPKGSGNNPDTMEFLCRESGNLKGMCLYLGSSRENEGYYVFPELEVQEGDFILFHCKPQGIDQEITETQNKGESGGLLSSPEAWDVWPESELPMPGTNGVISLYSLPQDGVIQDCLIYTNRQDDPNHDNLGWTSRVWNQIAGLPDQAWEGLDDGPLPSEALWVDDSTGTRSLCRSSLSEDNNRASDWHTTPTGGSSFGEANTDESYVP